MSNIDYSMVEILRGLTTDQQTLLQIEMGRHQKSKTVGVLLAFLLGGIGAHHFYMGKIGLGLLYLLFCWTFIPALIALVEIFAMSNRIDAYNLARANEIAARIRV